MYGRQGRKFLLFQRKKCLNSSLVDNLQVLMYKKICRIFKSNEKEEHEEQT